MMTSFKYALPVSYTVIAWINNATIINLFVYFRMIIFCASRVVVESLIGPENVCTSEYRS